MVRLGTPFAQLTNRRSDHDTMKGYMNEIQLLKRLDGNPNIIQLVEHDLRHAQQSNEGTLLMVSRPQQYGITHCIPEMGPLQVMELGEIDFSRLLQERAGLPISPPWIIVYWKQVVNHYPLCQCYVSFTHPRCSKLLESSTTKRLSTRTLSRQISCL